MNLAVYVMALVQCLDVSLSCLVCLSCVRISGRGRPITLAFRQLHAAVDGRREARRYWQGYLRLKTGEMEKQREGKRGTKGKRQRRRQRLR